jgi:Mn-dependent DtxR family transcriptional regulator
LAIAPEKEKYTKRQGQYLAFIYYYTKLHRRPPAEGDMQWYFQVTPPAVHQMVVTLEREGLITRIPGMPRTIQVLLPREELPDLE